MCDSTFALGQRGSHFFQCPSKTDHARLPAKLAKLLVSPQMKQIHHIALGYEDSFLLTWRDTRNQDRIDCADLPPELTTFLYDQSARGQWTRNVPNIQCVLGPYNDSWFVHDGIAYSWMNLPPKLLAALQTKIEDGNWTDRPRILALGANSNFILVTEKHNAIWELPQYRSLSTLLSSAQSKHNGVAEMHRLIIHPYRFEAFIIHLQSGLLRYANLPSPSLACVTAMLEPIKHDTLHAKPNPLPRKASSSLPRPPRKPSILQQRASLKKEWNQHNQQFSARAQGMKVSLSLSVSLGGVARLVGD
ncbi:hypothetical protein IAQ61_002354 [Plenodomus lingam]|uniref:uncharacterized protein n=1 Tax=Leptosphaeria maculans TaxID=5022 RepID=UPI0033320088|nr:hypothetical protein IAQ61_002354 [Plenodomus lingam]